VVPVIIPVRDSFASLVRAIEALQKRGRAFYADPILAPIHFGFTASLLRYQRLRRRFPEIDILMGVGNVTELTDADTSGINAILFGVISELQLDAVLTTSVSPHARRAIREADVARRMMFAARERNSLPRRICPDLMTVHDPKPFVSSPEAIRALAADVRDPNFRIQTSEQGIHVYNRAGYWTGTDPFDIGPQLPVAGDVSHAFYLGVELARAQIAWELGKRYSQDGPLNWNVAKRPDSETTAHCAPVAPIQCSESLAAPSEPVDLATPGLAESAVNSPAEPPPCP
jgi:dihydropteroate synthase-like protein